MSFANVSKFNIPYSEQQTFPISNFFLFKAKFIFLPIDEKGSSLLICFSNWENTINSTYSKERLILNYGNT